MSCLCSVVDYVNMDYIYDLLKYNSDKFFDFMSKSFMKNIDDKTTTSDLYIFLSRILKSYNMFIEHIYNYPVKKHSRYMFNGMNPFLVDETKLLQSSTTFFACVYEPKKKENFSYYDLKDNPLSQLNYLIEIETKYGLITDILKYLMSKLFSYKVNTLIDKKLNDELLSDNQFCDNIYKLAMFTPILMNTIKAFLD